MFKKNFITLFLKIKKNLKTFFACKYFVKFLIFFVSCVILIIGICFGNYYYQIFTPLQKNTEKKFFVIKQGEGVNQISQNLKDQKLIRSMWDFEVYIWQKKWGKKFKPENILYLPT